MDALGRGFWPGGGDSQILVGEVFLFGSGNSGGSASLPKCVYVAFDFDGGPLASGSAGNPIGLWIYFIYFSVLLQCF